MPRDDEPIVEFVEITHDGHSVDDVVEAGRPARPGPWSGRIPRAVRVTAVACALLAAGGVVLVLSAGHAQHTATAPSPSTLVEPTLTTTYQADSTGRGITVQTLAPSCVTDRTAYGQTLSIGAASAVISGLPGFRVTQKSRSISERAGKLCGIGLHAERSDGVTLDIQIAAPSWSTPRENIQLRENPELVNAEISVVTSAGWQVDISMNGPHGPHPSAGALVAMAHDPRMIR